MLKMHATIQMDRDVTERHYVMPGGYEMSVGNRKIVFDFVNSSHTVRTGNARLIDIEEENLDISVFPESIALEQEEFLRNISSINEFYVYTGESGEDPYIGVDRLVELKFELNGVIIPVSQDVIDAYNKTLLDADFFLYDMYEYQKGAPMVFILLPEPITDSQKVRILEKADEMYANTGRATSMWAMEYQLWTRFLLLQNSLPVVMRHLEMSHDDIEALCSIMGVHSNNATLFRSYANNAELHSLVQTEYKEDPDIQEGFSVSAANWPSVALK